MSRCESSAICRSWSEVRDRKKSFRARGAWGWGWEGDGSGAGVGEEVYVLLVDGTSVLREEKGEPTGDSFGLWGCD
jgi:hypothetical protein